MAMHLLEIHRLCLCFVPCYKNRVLKKRGVSTVTFLARKSSSNLLVASALASHSSNLNHCGGTSGGEGVRGSALREESQEAKGLQSCLSGVHMTLAREKARG